MGELQFLTWVGVSVFTPTFRRALKPVHCHMFAATFKLALKPAHPPMVLFHPSWQRLRQYINVTQDCYLSNPVQWALVLRPNCTAAKFGVYKK